MHGGLSRHLQHRNSASSGMGRSHTSDFDTMADEADVRCAEATDACIESLSANGKAAIYAHCLGGPWMLPSPSLAVFYRGAAMSIARRLDRMGIS